ncbi:MAG: LytR/AlgR family response regulator transcription factor [Chitinophagaceae bacterium]
MKVLIVEDERLAAQRLQHLLKQYDPSIEVVGITESITDTVQFLLKQPQPDLLLLDIQLSDGHSFDIFKMVQFSKPVIFTTAFDQFAIDAFKLFSIDYILKPVTAEALATALNKFHSIATPVSIKTDYALLAKQLAKESGNHFKNRFLAKVGQRLFFVEVADIAFFQADNKIVYLVDKDGNRFVIDYTLEKLELLLNPKDFFRLNRRFIVKVSAIEHIKPFYNSRLKLSVKGATASEEMIISRERVSEFKAWAES